MREWFRNLRTGNLSRRRIQTRKRVYHSFLFDLILIPVFSVGCVLFPVGPSESPLPGFRQLSDYSFSPETPLLERIQIPSAEVLEYLRELDSADYRPADPATLDNEKMHRAFRVLPENLREVLKERLVAIYFIQDFVTSGMTDWIQGQDGKLYGFIVFNPMVLEETVSDTIMRRERTAYIPSNQKLPFQIRVETDLSGFAYLLLHEGAHVADLVWQANPYLEEGVRESQEKASGRSSGDGLDTPGIWQKYRTPAKRFDFHYRDRVAFYGFRGGPHLENREAPEIYRGLSRSPFVSLYGSLSWAEDFAELFALHHLSAVLHAPYTIQVTEKSGEKTLYHPLENPLVRARLSRLKPFYQQNRTGGL